MKTTHDIYKYNKDNNLKMLSDYPSDFWSEYRTNHDKYDRVFDRMFMSFKYCFQNEEEDTVDIANNFREDVYNHLLMNDKKYSELYRVQVIPDTNYSLTDNYDVTETMDKDISDNNDNTYGARTDTIEETEGSRTDTIEETEGSRNDSSSVTEGERTDSRTLDVGSQTNNTIHSVAPYDSSTFNNESKDDETKGTRTDTEETVKGEQYNYSSMTKGSQINETESVKGSQVNETESVKGSQTDSLDRTYTEDYTLHRKGNIGVMTVSDMLKKHKDFWNAWEFYEYIFKEICKELLLI